MTHSTSRATHALRRSAGTNVPCDPLALREELRVVASGFSARLANAGIHTGLPPDRGAGPTNLALTLPFYLAEAVSMPDARAACRTMALANAFGAAHFLAQDDVVDAESALTPAVCRLSDTCLSVFTREYARLVGDRREFWEHFDRYMDEYFTSLQRERSSDQLAVEDVLATAGRKLSPLKVTAAAVCLLGSGAGRCGAVPGNGVRSPGTDAGESLDMRETLREMERTIESYHAAYQLADDLADLRSDLENRRPSAAVRIVAAAAGRSDTSDVGGWNELLMLAVRHGGLRLVLEEMVSRYRAAAASADRYGATALAGHLRELAARAQTENAWLMRRIRACVGLAPEPGRFTVARASRASRRLHRFRVHGDCFVFDPGSGLFFEADAAAYDAIEWLGDGGGNAGRAVLEMNHGAPVIETAVTELAALESATDERELTEPLTSATGAPRPGDATSLTSLALNISAECNLACDYCYLSGGRADTVDGGASGRDVGRLREGERTMSEDVARRATDLLVHEAFGERRVSLVLFGGEPLLAREQIGSVVEYARGRAAACGMSLSVHMTTNGTLLSPSVAAELDRLGVSVLVSIDGRRSEHDAHRCYPDGHGSYDDVASNLSRLPSGMRTGVRVTLTEDSGPMGEIVDHLARLGASVVHLSPESGNGMSEAFTERLGREFAELAAAERDRLIAGGAPLVGNFIDPMVTLETGRRRALPCGAGTRYLCVATDGTLSFCHRFASDSAYDVGHVATGVDRAKLFRVRERFATATKDCETCWAFPLCGGPCYHDVGPGGEPVGPRSPRCMLRRRCLEIAMWLYASLPEDARVRLRSSGLRSGTRGALGEAEAEDEMDSVDGPMSEGPGVGDSVERIVEEGEAA